MHLTAAALGLTFLLHGAAAQEPDPTPDAATLQREFDTAQREHNARQVEARKAGDQAEIARLRESTPERAFLPRFLAGAAQHAGTPAAVPYLVWVVSRGSVADATTAMTTLMTTHVDDPGIRLAVARIGGLKQSFGAQTSREWLDLVLERNDDTQVRAQALFTRAAMYVGTRAVETGDALRRYAIADLEASRALLDRADAAPTRSLAGLVDALLDEARRLEPGLPAPEITGEDLDGVAFKLSDYRGKVVVLDFWGDW